MTDVTLAAVGPSGTITTLETKITKINPDRQYCENILKNTKTA